MRLPVGMVSAAGHADVVRRQPADARIPFRIAGNTKEFTAAVVLQLVGEKRLALEDRTAGALVSTVDVLARFHRALFGGTLLRPAELAEMNRVAGGVEWRRGCATLTVAASVTRVFAVLADPATHAAITVGVKGRGRS